MSETDVTTLQRLRRTAIRYLRHGGRSWSDVYLDDQKTSGRWAFIHINKCGGTSVERALRIPKFHHTARQRRDIVGSDRWGQMTTFTIVRHPYPRIRSLYKYRIKTGQTGMAERHIGLDDWIRAVFREQDPAYRDNPQMFLPARGWLTDETDTIIVDIIARLESIDADWAGIQSRIGTDVALPKENTTSGGGTATSDGLSPASRDIIAEVFAADFDTFGYAR